MDKLLSKIGWAAEDLQPHARLLTLDRDDPSGSAAVGDEEEIDTTRPIVNEDDRLDDDDLDDAPIRGRRTDKSAKAYDELKSERDRLKADSDKKDRLIEEFNARLTRMEQGQGARESREDVNRRADEERERINARAKRLVEKVQAIKADDPERGQKIYEAMEAHNEEIRKEERELLRQEIDERSRQAVEQRLSDKEARAQARLEAVAELERQGLDEECFDLVQALAIAKRNTDPGWFKRTSAEDQIPELVQTLKERLMKGKRSSQDLRDEKRRHREDQDGVLGDSSATKRRSLREQDDGEEGDGPGSMLADLSRWKGSMRRDTNRMLGRETRR